YQIRIFDLEGLLPATVLFKYFDNQNLIIRYRELVKQEYVLVGGIARDFVKRFVHTQWYHRLFLHYGTFRYFLIHDLEIHKVNLKWHIAFIAQFRMEIEFTV